MTIVRRPIASVFNARTQPRNGWGRSRDPDISPRTCSPTGGLSFIAGTAVCAPAARAGTVTGSVDGIFTIGGTSNLDTHGHFGAVNAGPIGQSVHLAFQYTTPFSESPINPNFGFGAATVTLAITVNGTTIGLFGLGTTAIGAIRRRRARQR